MEDERIKARIGANIAGYRKSAGLTQLELAEKLNYSDKAVSKWERGDSVPDVLTLMAIASLFSITVNDLLADPSALPEVSEPSPKAKAGKGFIQALCTTLVWFVAMFFFVVISTLGYPHSWIAFVYAIPANAIVLLSLRSAWHIYSWNKALISAIVWGSLASIYVSSVCFLQIHAWKIFLLGIPGQIAIGLWFAMLRKPKEEPNE